MSSRNAWRRAAARLCAGVLALGLLAGLAGCAARPGQQQRYTATYWDVFDTVTVLTGYADSESEWQASSSLCTSSACCCHSLSESA